MIGDIVSNVDQLRTEDRREKLLSQWCDMQSHQSGVVVSCECPSNLCALDVVKFANEFPNVSAQQATRRTHVQGLSRPRDQDTDGKLGLERSIEVPAAGA